MERNRKVHLQEKNALVHFYELKVNKEKKNLQTMPTFTTEFVIVDNIVKVKKLRGFIWHP